MNKLKMQQFAEEYIKEKMKYDVNEAMNYLENKYGKVFMPDNLDDLFVKSVQKQLHLRLMKLYGTKVRAAKKAGLNRMTFTRRLEEAQNEPRFEQV